MNIFRNTTLAIGITSLTALTSAALPGISSGSAFTGNDQNCSDEIKQHLYYETADAFEDPYIHEYAVRFDEFGLRNCDYEAKYMGSGIGYGDHLFTEGFSFSDNPADPNYNCYIVKVTLNEFDSYLSEITPNYYIKNVDENPDEGYILYSLYDNEGTIIDVTYRTDQEVLFQETFYDQD